MDAVQELIKEVERLRRALARVALPEAFHVATSNVDPEARMRMFYAQYVLVGLSLEAAERVSKRRVGDE